MSQETNISLSTLKADTASRFTYVERATPLHCVPIVQTEFFIHGGTRYEKEGGEPKYFVITVKDSSRANGLDIQFELFIAPVLRISDGFNFLMVGTNLANLHYLISHPMDTTVKACLYGDGRSFVIFENKMIEDDLTGNSGIIETRIQEYLAHFKTRLERAL